MASEVVGDTTDPKGTLRPNLPPEPAPGKKFVPLYCPSFHHQKNIPLNTSSFLDFWHLFITKDDIELMVDNTNARAYKREKDQWEKGFKYPRKWKEVFIGDIYIFLGIWILMSIHPESQIEHYWSKGPGMARYPDITSAMSCNRWEDISRNFHISDPILKLSPFEKVGYFT